MKTLLALAVAARLAVPSAAQMTMPPTLAGLVQAFHEEMEDQRKAEILVEISRTPPREPRDVIAVVDLFNRYRDDRIRAAAVSAIELTSTQSVQLEPAFESYVASTEPSEVILGIKGALRLRSPSSHALIEKLAKKKFTLADPDATGALPSEKDAWWAQYEAIYALAVWDGDAALPVVLKRSKEAPGVGRILGALYWKKILPQLARWAGGGTADRRRASAALTASVPSQDLRATRAMMLAVVSDPKADAEVRHQLALKLGLSSTADDVDDLLKRYDAAKDERLQLLLAAAIFASRSPKAVPLLERYVKEAPAAQARTGARIQLKDMLPAAEYRKLVEWTAANDPDPGNRNDAQTELKTLK